VSPQQAAANNLLAQIQGHVAAIHSMGAKDVTVAGLKAAHAAAQIAAHPTTLGSGGVLNVADAATKTIAQNAAKDQTLKGLETQLATIAKEYGTGSEQYKNAMGALKSTVEKWFPQLSQDKSVAKQTADIVSKQQQLYETSVTAQQALASIKEQEKSIAGGESLGGLKKNLGQEQTQLKHMQETHAGTQAIQDQKNVITGTKASIDDMKALIKQANQDKAAIDLAQKQYTELQALKDGLTGNLKNLQTAMDSAAKASKTDLGTLGTHITNKLDTVGIAKLPQLSLTTNGTLTASLNIT
jgi:chromosome segregation ATPase